MTSSFLWLLLTALCCDASSGEASTSSPLHKTWTLYHTTFVDKSNNIPTFVPRGRIHLTLQDDEESTDESSSPKPNKYQDDSSPFKITVDHEPLTETMVQSLLQPGAWYQLKVVSDDDETAEPILTTVPACQVRRANFRDEFVLTMASFQAKILSMAYLPLISPLAPTDCQAYADTTIGDDDTFDSKFSIETAVPGMTLKTILPETKPPPGLHVLKGERGTPNPLAGGSDKEAPPQADNSPFGFIKRYWYILLPLFLAQFIFAEPPPQEQQQQGGQQQQQQQQQQSRQQQPAARQAAAPATGQAASSPARKQRRGKRG